MELLALMAIIGAFAYVTIAGQVGKYQDRKTMSWYTHVCHYPEEHIDDSVNMRGRLTQQILRFSFVFVEDNSGDLYYIKLIHGAKYQRARQNDAVTIAGRVAGSQECPTYNGGDIVCPYLEVYYLNVEGR